jgi:hypothetical protein
MSADVIVVSIHRQRLFTHLMRAEQAYEEWCLVICYAVWLLFLQEPHGVTSQKTAFFIVTAVKTPNLTQNGHIDEEFARSAEGKRRRRRRM